MRFAIVRTIESMAGSRDGGVAAGVIPPSLESSTVVMTVVDAVLSAIDEGRLLPGDRLSDTKLALQLGVSRTPVREAFQRLREVGLIEASANRFTRITLVTPRQTADTLVVWLALMDALVDEIVPDASEELIADMRVHHSNFVAAVSAKNPLNIASTNVAFFNAAAAHSSNTVLQYTFGAAIQLVRLGGLRLRGHIDFGRITEAQSMLLEATTRHDLAAAHRSVAHLRGLQIPRDETVSAPLLGRE